MANEKDWYVVHIVPNGNRHPKLVQALNFSMLKESA